MKIFCIKNQFLSRQAEYVISYLLNRSGFFFEWNTDITELVQPGIILYYAPSEMIIETSFPVFHLPKKFELENIDKETVSWDETEIENERIPILKEIRSKRIGQDKYLQLPFDITANIYFHLARIEEFNYNHPDEVDENAAKSILFNYKNFMLPIVDILVKCFIDNIRNIIKEHNLFFIQKGLYPSGEDFAVAITHDVDFIRAFHPIKKLVLKILIKFGLLRSTTIEKIDELEKNYWGFDRLLKYYCDNKYNATFFFIAKYIENFSFRYRISSKRFRKLFKDLKTDNHEIAFHPSRFSFEHPKRYSKEIKKLEKKSQTEIEGLRHHYLRCTYPQIWKIVKKLGLKYDASLIHRNYSGFRAATCCPFPTFDHVEQQELGVVEFPTLFFENTLPDDGNDINKSKEVIKSLFLEVKNNQGIFNVLWHTNNIYQPENYIHLWNF